MCNYTYIQIFYKFLTYPHSGDDNPKLHDVLTAVTVQLKYLNFCNL